MRRGRGRVVINRRNGVVESVSREFGRPRPFLRSSNVRRDVRVVKKRLRKMVSQEELNWIDTAITSVTINNTPAFTLLNGCTQGDTAVTRDGNEITCTSLQIRFRLMPSAQTDANAVVTTSSYNTRIIYFWDRQPNKAVPSGLGDILDQTTLDSMVVPYNYTNKKRFKILWDYIWEPKNKVHITTDSNIADSVYIRKRIKLGRSTSYSGNAGTVADINTNSLYMVAFTSTKNVVMLGGIRLYFKDH